MVSTIVFSVIAVFCILGPLVSPHRYDQQFRSFVGVPPSLEPRPAVNVLEAAMQVAELDYIAGSQAAQTAIAENYVGLPV